MANENKLVPKNPNEIVVPVGKANLVTTKEEVDEALEIAARIFREEGEQEMEVKLETPTEVADKSEDDATIQDLVNVVEGAIEEPDLIVLTQKELDVLPKSKFGRDKYGRSLNKNGTPRKGRSDKGSERGTYSPRTKKSDLE
jgi:hypothetical protein